jgi:hypothetical protein
MNPSSVLNDAKSILKLKLGIVKIISRTFLGTRVAVSVPGTAYWADPVQHDGVYR